MPALASSNQELNSMSLMYNKAGPSQTSFLPVSSMPFSSSSIMGSASGPITTLPPLLTPNQLTKPASAATSLDKLYPEPKDAGALLPSSMNSSSAVSGMPQEPLLPLPTAPQRLHGERGAVQFTEEFDFTAMNGQFNKDEVWGSLGKGKQRPTMGDRTEDDPIRYNVEVNEGYVQEPPKARSKFDLWQFIWISIEKPSWLREILMPLLRLKNPVYRKRLPMGHGNYMGLPILATIGVHLTEEGAMDITVEEVLVVLYPFK